MSAQSYSAYRDTGVEWLGSVPSHWQVVRLNALFREVSDPGSDELPVLSVSIHSGVSDTELADDEMDRKVARSEDRSKYKRVEPNDLVYNMMRAWQGGFGTVQTVGAVSPAYVVARPTSSQSTRFVERLLRTPTAIGEMKRLSKGVTDFRLRLYWDEFKNIKVALPPSDEQAAIDAFLDRETAKIDALVEVQRRLIELLKEKRQAVISHAVTKGLDPSAPMKDSGVEWLGQVPAHWEVKPLMRLTEPGRAIMYGIVLPGPDVDEGIPIVKGGDVKPHRLRLELLARTTPEIEAPFARARLKPGDIVYSIRGSIGDAEPVPDELLDANITQDAARISPRSDVCKRWLLQVMRSSPVFVQLEQRSLGAAVRGINIFDLKRARVPFPPREEQGEIGEFLEAETEAFDRLAKSAAEAVSLLQERRAALISAAVTGKIDVRGLVKTAEAA